MDVVCSQHTLEDINKEDAFLCPLFFFIYVAALKGEKPQVQEEKASGGHNNNKYNAKRKYNNNKINYDCCIERGFVALDNAEHRKDFPGCKV